MRRGRCVRYPAVLFMQQSSVSPSNCVQPELLPSFGSMLYDGNYGNSDKGCACPNSGTQERTYYADLTYRRWEDDGTTMEQGLLNLSLDNVHMSTIDINERETFLKAMANDWSGDVDVVSLPV